MNTATVTCYRCRRHVFVESTVVDEKVKKPRCGSVSRTLELSCERLARERGLGATVAPVTKDQTGE